MNDPSQDTPIDPTIFSVPYLNGRMEVRLFEKRANVVYHIPGHPSNPYRTFSTFYGLDMAERAVTDAIYLSKETR
jgi:hypothetical protein